MNTNDATRIMDDPAGAAGFDIEDFDDASTGEYKIKHPTNGTDTGIIVTLAGPEHPLRKKHEFSRIRRMRKEVQRLGKLQLTDPAEDEQDETEFLASCILFWNKMPKGGQNVTYSPEAALALMQDPKRRWLRAQIKAGVEERELFIEGSADN